MTYKKGGVKYDRRKRFGGVRSVAVGRNDELLESGGAEFGESRVEVSDCVPAQAQSAVVGSVVGVQEDGSPATTQDGRRVGERTVLLLGE
jgi:hypothetical protein